MARPPGAKARPSVWLNYGIAVFDVAEGSVCEATTSS
jgi:hypothetical protein